MTVEQWKDGINNVRYTVYHRVTCLVAAVQDD